MYNLAIYNLRLKSHLKLIPIETHFSSETLVTADPVHVSNIISNLIENAVKYSGKSVHIVVDCLLQDHQLMIRVADDGIGIPVSEQNRVFDKFYRGSNLPDRSLPGIGPFVLRWQRYGKEMNNATTDCFIFCGRMFFYDYLALCLFILVKG